MVSLNITTSVEQDTYNLARRFGISWTDALEEGIKQLVKEKEDLITYGHILTVEKVSEKKDKIIEELQKKIEELEEHAEVLKVLKTDAEKGVNGNGKTTA